MIEPLARLGYASKALIYVIVGGLAAAAAANRGGHVTDTSGALRVILSQPFGQLLLMVLGVGLCGYAVWRFLDALRDPDRHGADFQGLVTRIGNVVRGLVYGALGIEAFRLARGLRGSRGNEAEAWTAKIMDLPLGEWIVAITGCIIVGFGISEVICALKLQISRQIDLTPVPSALRGSVIKISRFGVGARGAILAVLGVFLVRAALQHDPSEVHGTRESVLEIANAVQGRWLLAAIAAGLIAYGIDQALHARCRRITPVT
jgi:hypothetical protein